MMSKEELAKAQAEAEERLKEQLGTGLDSVVTNAALTMSRLLRGACVRDAAMKYVENNPHGKNRDLALLVVKRCDEGRT